MPTELRGAKLVSWFRTATKRRCARLGMLAWRSKNPRICQGTLSVIIKLTLDLYCKKISFFGFVIFLITIPLNGQETPGGISLLEVPGSIQADEGSLSLVDPALKGLKEFIQAGDWEKARSVAQRLMVRNPQDPNPHYWLGYVLLRQHQGIAAIPLLRKAERLGLEQPDFPKVLGLAYYTLNQFVLFSRQMRKAIEADPQDPWPHFYLGLYELQMRENYKKAQVNFNQSLKLQPNNARARYYHGYCHEMLGEYDRAQNDYENALELLKLTQASFSLPYQRMAKLSAGMNLDKTLSYKYALRAVEINPNLAENHLILAKIHESQGKLTATVQELREAARIDPTLALPHYRLFRILLKQGEKNAADTELAEFQRLTKLYGP